MRRRTLGQLEVLEYHWRDIAEETDDKKKIHALRWEVYIKEK